MMSKLIKSALVLIFLTAISKVFGFGRDVILAYKYGVSYISDAFTIAFSIPSILFEGFTMAVLSCYIPVYNEMKRNEANEINRFNSNLINTLLIINLLFIILFEFFSSDITRMFALGFDKKTLDITIKLSEIIIVSTLFMTVSRVMQSVLQANEQFFTTGIMSIVFNVFIILGILFSTEKEYYILAFGVILGYFSWIIVFLPSVRRVGFRYIPFYINFKDKNLRKLIIMVLPVFLGTIANQLNTIIDKTMASTLAIGSVSALNYANKLTMLVKGMLISSVVMVIFPNISIDMINNDIDKVKKTTINSMTILSIIIIPLTIGCIVLAEPIVKLLFYRGAFDKVALSLTSESLVFYSISILAVGYSEILCKVFYSMHDTKTPMINAFISIVINIILNFLLIKSLKHMGLALSTSISSIVACILLFVSLRKKIGSFGVKNMMKSLLKMVLSSLVMGVLVSIMYIKFTNFFPNNTLYLLLNIICTIGVGSIIYFMLLRLLKLKEIDFFIVIIKKFAKKLER